MLKILQQPYQLLIVTKTYYKCSKQEVVCIACKRLVMAIAAQICTNVAIRDVDDYTIAFGFQIEHGVTSFLNELEAYSNRLSLIRLGLEVIVTFALRLS